MTGLAADPGSGAQHFLYFLPLPQGHGSFRPDFTQHLPGSLFDRPWRRGGRFLE
jgi:hypothetical protein